MRATNLLLLLACLASSPGSAQTLRIAGLYPTNNQGHYNCTCGLEAACITDAAVKKAQAEGMDIYYEQFDKGWSVEPTIEATDKAIAGKFDVAVGTLVSADAIAAAERLTKAKIPFFVPTATNPQVTANNPYATRIAFNDFRQAALLAKFATRELKTKKIAVVRNFTMAYSDFLASAFEKEIKRISPKIVVREYKMIDGSLDTKTAVDQMLADKADLIFVPISQKEISNLYAELANRNVKITLLASDTVEARPQFLAGLGRASQTIRFIYPKHWNESAKGPDTEQYLKLLKTKCGQYKPSMTSAAAYDAIELLLATMKSHPKARGKELIRLAHETPFHGVTGVLRYGTDGDPIKALELSYIKGNKSIYWKRYE